MNKRIHKFNCQCPFCKAHRQELTGINNPNYNNHKLIGENNPNFGKGENIRGNKNVNYIDGRSIRKTYCKDCNKKIGYRAVRCGSCATKKRIKELGHSPNWLGNKAKSRWLNYCSECGVKITYISKKCKSCATKLENNPNWVGGKSFEPYTLGWNKTYREQIRYRDGYKCQICNKPEVENNRKLHVHHIDYKKDNLNINNLISLCTKCHIKTNFNRDHWKEYFNVNLNISSK
jgi:hypothetical protein